MKLMKTLFFTIAALLCFSASVFAELSVEDLEKIRQIVNESEARTEKRISESEARIEKRISESEARTAERIAELEKRFSAEIRAQGKRLDFHGALIIALIVAIIAFVAVPVGFITYQYNRHHAQRNEEIRTLREKIEALERERILEA